MTALEKMTCDLYLHLQPSHHPRCHIITIWAFGTSLRLQLVAESNSPVIANNADWGSWICLITM